LLLGASGTAIAVYGGGDFEGKKAELQAPDIVVNRIDTEVAFINKNREDDPFPIDFTLESIKFEEPAPRPYIPLPRFSTIVTFLDLTVSDRNRNRKGPPLLEIGLEVQVAGPAPSTVFNSVGPINAQLGKPAAAQLSLRRDLRVEDFLTITFTVDDANMQDSRTRQSAAPVIDHGGGTGDGVERFFQFKAQYSIANRFGLGVHELSDRVGGERIAIRYRIDLADLAESTFPGTPFPGSA
jgi:hypothetical protein